MQNQTPTHCPAPGPWLVTMTDGKKAIWHRVVFDADAVAEMREKNPSFTVIAIPLFLALSAPVLVAYAECEEAYESTACGRNNVLIYHGWNTEEETAKAFLIRLRRSALASARGAS